MRRAGEMSVEQALNPIGGACGACGIIIMWPLHCSIPRPAQEAQEFEPSPAHLRRRHGMYEVHRALRKSQQQCAAAPVLRQASQDGGQRCIVLVSLLARPRLERIGRQLRAAGGVEGRGSGGLR